MLLCTGRSSKVQTFTEVIAVGSVSVLQVAAASRSRFTPCTEVTLSLVCGIAADDESVEMLCPLDLVDAKRFRKFSTLLENPGTRFVRRIYVQPVQLDQALKSYIEKNRPTDRPTTDRPTDRPTDPGRHAVPDIQSFRAAVGS